MRKLNIPLWFIAKRIGVSSNTFYRKLREPLKMQPELKEQITNALNGLQKEDDKNE